MQICRLSRDVLATLIVIAIASLLAAPAVAQCNLAVPPCPGVGPCSWSCNPPLEGGCAGAVGLGHGAFSACTVGSFDLIGTRYENTCATGAGGCTKLQPRLRYWGFDEYTTANYGCGWPGDDEWQPWLVNWAYGTDFTAVDSPRHGKNMGYTDWTHGGPAEPFCGDGNIDAGEDCVNCPSDVGPCLSCPADIDGDGEVGIVDFLTLLDDWGPCE